MPALRRADCRGPAFPLYVRIDGVIIYFTPGGRLGNQFFQFAFLTSLARPGEVCITTRMEQLLAVVRTYLRIWNISTGLLYRVLDRLLLPLVLRPLSRHGVFSAVTEDGRGGLCRRKGILPWITLVEGYFQRQVYVPSAFREAMRIKPALVRRARDVLALLPAGTPKVSVHVRRTDYHGLSILGELDPTLPLSYYSQLLRHFQATFSHPTFIFLSDDTEWVERTFSSVTDRLVSRNEAGVDLALMTLCDGAILSNSSLSWWGAFLMRPGSPRFCPRFWLGWKSRVWHPEGIEPSFAVAVEVQKN